MTRSPHTGMTIWEWLAILALVAGFGFVLLTGARRADMVADARSLKNELEEIDRVIRQAEGEGKIPEDGIWSPGEYLPLTREKFTRMRETGGDPFGNPYPPVRRGGRPMVPAATASALEGRLAPSFWSPFLIERPAADVAPEPVSLPNPTDTP